MTPTAAATRRDPHSLTDPDAEPAAILARLDEWRSYYGAEDGYAGWVLMRLVAAAHRLDRDTAEESALRIYEAERARLSWDADRRLAAEDLGAGLALDPGRVRRRLEGTLQGADWLIERWEALGRLAGSGQPWTDPQRALALDLLGTPAALRAGPAPFDPAPGAPAAPVQLAVAEAECARLDRLRERSLRARDEKERALAVAGVPLSFSPAMIRLRRHEAFWSREYHRALAEFRRATRRPADATPPAPVPVSIPPPAAAPAPPPELNPDPELSTFERKLTALLIESRDAAVESALAARPVAPPDAPAPPPSGGNRRARRARLARLRKAG